MPPLHKTWLNGLPAAHWKSDEYLKSFFSLRIYAGSEGTVLFRSLKVLYYSTTAGGSVNR